MDIIVTQMVSWFDIELLAKLFAFIPTGTPFLLQEYTGFVPPLLPVAVKFTWLPAHIVVALAAKLTVGGISGLTVIII